MCKRKKKALEEREKAIRAKWKELWEHDPSADVKEDGKFFLEWLEANMDFLYSRRRWNKWKNYGMKFAVLLGIIVAYGIVFHLSYKEGAISLIIGSTALFVPSFVLYKWINVRKYQETWSRFSAFHSRILQEMTKYLYRISPYDQGDVKKQFIESIIGLVEQNIEKFCKNMEEKEERMFSGLDLGEIKEP